MTSYAAERAKLLLGCYRTGEANDPDTYVAAVMAVLARYPEEVITSVTHPVTGLPSKKSWLPTVKEVSEACAHAHQPIVENVIRLQRIKEQMEMRDRMAKGKRPTLEQLKAKYGPDWGISNATKSKGPPAPAPTIDQLRHHYQHYDLGFKPKNHAELEDHINRGFSPASAP